MEEINQVVQMYAFVGSHNMGASAMSGQDMQAVCSAWLVYSSCGG